MDNGKFQDFSAYTFKDILKINQRLKWTGKNLI